MEERPPVLAVRAAMDLQHEGVQLVRVQVLRLQEPALDHPAVGGGELMALRLCDVAIAEPRIEIGQPGLRALGEHVQLARVVHVRRGKRDHA